MITPDYTALEASIAQASKIIAESNQDLTSKLSSLTNEIKTASKSSHRLGTIMIVLTIVIAAAAVASTIAAFIN